jgi:hypothetical protein
MIKTSKHHAIKKKKVWAHVLSYVVLVVVIVGRRHQNINTWLATIKWGA